MAEQWPFKPLVERSSRSTLTFYFLLWLVAAPAGGVKFEPLHAHFLFNRLLVAVPAGGNIRAPSGTQQTREISWEFLFCQSMTTK